MKKMYIRLLSYDNAVKVINFVDSLNNYDDYAYLTSGGVGWKFTDKNKEIVIEFIQSLNVRYELSDRHPSIVKKKSLKNTKVGNHKNNHKIFCITKILLYIVL